ncbi:hypothetical protein EB796_005122 [Bugula neritina]|uniref:GAL3ST1 n=1 Tax=Bugula neritina TaxID=10212 RepID=A0A7J7KG09_BUGNE|nr:hypothetical protein EB796_005122 [Bugula neritina]
MCIFQGSNKRFYILNLKELKKPKDVATSHALIWNSLTTSLSFSKPLKGKSVFNPRPYNSSHIVYLKVHKAASSTVQNIVMRASMKRNLTFALPARNNTHQFGWPAKFSRFKHLKKLPSKPDVLCLHTVLSDSLIKTMPQDSFYFTSLRDPFTQIRSMFEYYNLSKCLYPKHSATLLEVIGSGKNACDILVIKSPQAFDLGINLRNADNDTVIADFIQLVEKQFHFVIIVEYFNECLILLRDMLGWTTQDILYFKSNFKGKRKQLATNLTLLPEDNEKTRAIIYKFLKADLALYKHFKSKLEQTIASKKDYINAEIVKLKHLQKIWMADCVKDFLPANELPDKRFQPYGAGSYGYLLTEKGFDNSTCVSLSITELPHFQELNKYQNKLLNIST